MNRTFPGDFLLGTATASYQVEGGFVQDGRGSINRAGVAASNRVL